jgi:RimJ/RimL family protein N-acetyltransferase
MTLAHGAGRLESARLVLRRITQDDLPFFSRIHALPKVAQHLYPGGRPRSGQETAAFLQSIFESYEQLALGYLAVLRKEDGALIGRCGLMELVVESAVPEHGLRKGWFGPPEASLRVVARDRWRNSAPAGVDEIGVTRTRCTRTSADGLLNCLLTGVDRK